MLFRSCTAVEVGERTDRHFRGGIGPPAKKAWRVYESHVPILEFHFDIVVWLNAREVLCLRVINLFATEGQALPTRRDLQKAGFLALCSVIKFKDQGRLYCFENARHTTNDAWHATALLSTRLLSR